MGMRNKRYLLCISLVPYNDQTIFVSMGPLPSIIVDFFSLFNHLLKQKNLGYSIFFQRPIFDFPPASIARTGAQRIMTPRDIEASLCIAILEHPNANNGTYS
jgi:hypothetical protein